MTFGANDDHSSIRAEISEAKPDFEAGEYAIECKVYTSNSSVHGANLVIRHSRIESSKPIYFCLVGD